MPVTITIDNRVRVATPDLSPEVIKALKSAFEHSNPEYFKRMNLGLSVWNVGKSIRMWEDSLVDELRFPRGGLARINEVLAEHGVDRHFVDKRTEGSELSKGTLPAYNRKLWAHQERMIEAVIEKQNCILRAPTGSGKTSFAFALAARLNLPTLVIVPSRALFDQWLRRACSKEELGMRKSSIGIIQGKRRSMKPLTIAMQKTLAQNPLTAEEMNYFGVVICDEVQLFAAKTFIKAVDPFPAKYRVGISADHRRKDKKEFLIHDLFGGVAAEISRNELISLGVIVDTEIRVVPTDFEAPWYGRPDDVDELREDVFPNAEKEINLDRLLTEMADSVDRNNKILWAVEQGLAMKEQVIVMSHRREHCRLIDQFLVQRGRTTGFLIGGEDYKVQFNDTREKFEKGKIDIAVGTFQAIGYGIDLPKAATVVCATPIASNQQFFSQVRGRVCRSAKGKSDSWMYYLWDRRLYGIHHVKNLVRWNRGRVVVWDHERWVDGKLFIRAQRVGGSMNGGEVGAHTT